MCGLLAGLVFVGGVGFVFFLVAGFCEGWFVTWWQRGRYLFGQHKISPEERFVNLHNKLAFQRKGLDDIGDMLGLRVGSDGLYYPNDSKYGLGNYISVEQFNILREDLANLLAHLGLEVEVIPAVPEVPERRVVRKKPKPRTKAKANDAVGGK